MPQDSEFSFLGRFLIDIVYTAPCCNWVRTTESTKVRWLKLLCSEAIVPPACILQFLTNTSSAVCAEVVALQGLHAYMALRRSVLAIWTASRPSCQRLPDHPFFRAGLFAAQPEKAGQYGNDHTHKVLMIGFAPLRLNRNAESCQLVSVPTVFIRAGLSEPKDMGKRIVRASSSTFNII